MSKPKIDLALLRVERNPLDPPGFLESQKSGEESPVTHGWDPMRGNGYRVCDRRMMLTYFGCHLCITRPPETPIGRSLPRTDSIAPLCASSTVGSTPPPLQILSISSPSRRAVV